MVTVQGFNKLQPMQEVQIGGAITACDLPDDTTVLLKVNETLLFGNEGCLLLSITQMREHQVVVDEKPQRHGGFPHIEADGCILPLALRNGLLTLPIGTPTIYELHNCKMIVLTSEEPQDPNDIHD